MEFRDLPAVDTLARDLARSSDLPKGLVTAVARDAIDEARDAIRAGGAPSPAERAAARLRVLASTRLRPVVNATGILLHTNLGRAPVPTTPRPTYANLEIDLSDGSRGQRATYLRTLIAATVGAEASLVVNNNAGALLLALAALAGRDGRVAVSRGELIEIGGSFRLPELMAASGAVLVEVGTTNRTRESDFTGLRDGIAAFLKVHPSNYRVEGFTDEVPFARMADIATERGVPFIADVGSGLLDASVPWLPDGPPSWLGDEPGVRQTLEQGAGVVLFSGDKLLGGPQAGIVVGREDLVASMARHPMARALRIDAHTIGSLTATFEAYAAGAGASIPFWAMAGTPEQALADRTEHVRRASGARGTVVEGESLPGAGSVPGRSIPTPVLRLDGDAEDAWAALASHDPPVVAARRDGATVVNLRAVLPDEDATVTSALASI